MQNLQISIEFCENGFCDKLCQHLATGQWFSLDTPETDKTDHHNGTEIFLKVAYNTKDYNNRVYLAMKSQS
jgi:hypothetical protein